MIVKGIFIGFFVILALAFPIWVAFVTIAYLLGTRSK
jgi:hypothetical protein